MNNIARLILIALITLSSRAFAQDVNIDLIGKKFDQAVAFEKKNKSKIYTSDDDIIIPGGMAVPVIYSRPYKDFRDVTIEYTFSQKDSIIRRIEYKWGATNTKELLRKKYDLLLSSLDKLYGKSRSTTENEHHWTTKDKIEVTLYGNFTDYPKVSLYASMRDK